ncbi:alpha/beta hydrolase family protein [Streptomyces sp. AK02-01A]|uniref:alpha/beta hydrolase family protein n=1 Tax=Streptomyces sp. AK02-01A TaxID=3028648 RepID=UPI0029BEEE56|nr:prolyl oligopeptidase family serine peptidase [Streptomyces sp. AK02-01A]MDX3852698.1 prolyl oligopeptidase family serine peptidase [Streptomyces sp. AK02-01A]
MSTVAPYGSWHSPVDSRTATAGLAAGQIAAPSYVGVVGDEVWWVEPRPDEGGRTALMRGRADGVTRSLLPAPWDVRSRVIEYGGRPWAAARDGRSTLVVFTHCADQRLYAFRTDGPGSVSPYPLTPVSAVGGGLRWAEPVLDLARGEVRCVLEEFTGDGAGDVRRLHAAVPLDGSAATDRSGVRELSPSAHRFVSQAQYAPDGGRAVWLAWDHPHMPWDAAELRIADVTQDGFLRGARTLLGGPGDPVAQAEWSVDGGLVAACERTGWWNLYAVDPDTGDTRPLHQADEEFAGLQRLGHRWFQPLSDGRIAVLHGVGAQRLAVLDPARRELVDVPGEKTEWLPHLDAAVDRVVGVAAGRFTSYEVMEVSTVSLAATVVGRTRRHTVATEYLPAPVARVFAGPQGREVQAHINFPRNPDFSGPRGELPPLVIWAHGGPGLRAPLALNPEIAYFTSRGIAVADVNYGGTPGYGRDYRERLRGQWGVVDVEDCAAVARGLINEGSAAPGRIAIRGGSAGGFTAAVSVTKDDLYACATLFYPLLDLLSVAEGGTHDFESHYLETLVGPVHQSADLYRDRSPVHHADRVATPLLLFQGADDVVCPPLLLEDFVRTLERHSVRHDHHVFDGEGHGFRRQPTLMACLEAELRFYADVFGFPPAGPPTRLGRTMDEEGGRLGQQQR